MSLLLQIADLSLSFPHKICFEPFSADIYTGARIVLIGNNGTGKSMLLKALAERHDLCNGSIRPVGNTTLSYVPQTVNEYHDLSGGERFNQALSDALAESPDILLLDEPTNHLDNANRKSLMRLVQSFQGAIIAATHDTAFIEACFDSLWHINRSKITVFKGSYREYCVLNEKEHNAVDYEISKIKQKKKEAHESLMQEQKRAKNAKLSGEKKRANKTVLPAKFDMMKSNGKKSTGKKQAILRDRKEELNDRLSELYTPEVLKPRFHLPHKGRSRETAIQIVNGSISYGNTPLQDGLSLTLGASERMALTGPNGSGKTTLIKAILNDPTVIKEGEWYVPPQEAIGYLDQYYGNLDDNATVYETVQSVSPAMTHAELRTHLNDFLFRKNEEINTKVQHLSGGEKARLSLAAMALKTPALLILDEITNNIDLMTKEYIVQILEGYPGALLVISHDSDFLKAIHVEKEYLLAK